MIIWNFFENLICEYKFLITFFHISGHTLPIEWWIFDPMFILTSNREYDENPIITSRTMTLPIERRQVDCIDWNIYYNMIQLDIIRCFIFFYNISMTMNVSDITRRALFFLAGYYVFSQIKHFYIYETEQLP